MIKYLITFFCFLFFIGLKAQIPDTSSLKKQYSAIEDLELSYPDSAIKLYENLIKEIGVFQNRIKATAYHRIAELRYHKTNDFKEYFDNNFKAVKIFEAIQDSFGFVKIYENLGTALSRQSRFTEAITYHKIVYDFALTHHNSDLLVSGAMSLADCYSSILRSDTALIILNNLEKNFPKDLDKLSLGTFYTNIGNAYFNAAEQSDNKSYYTKVVDYANKAQKIFDKESNDPCDNAYNLGLLAAAYTQLGKLDEAETNYLTAISIEEKLNHLADLNILFIEMTQLQIMRSNKEKSLYYFMKHDSVTKLIYNESNTNSISEMKILFETEKKEKENQLLQTQNQLSNKTIKQQRIITIIIIVGLVLLSMLALFIFRGLKQQRKANSIISEQKQIVENQKQLVEEHQKEILDSIHYAKRIQNTLLAHHDFLDENLPNNFVLFKPKDIVSGDFYWATKHGNKFYLAVCDSTGHGVPGAFMSLLNIGFLSEAINEKNILEPHKVLEHVRQRLTDGVSKEGQKDGFDGILLCINKETNEITYAAAHNAPVLFSNGELTELGKDKMPVGVGERKEEFKLYTIHPNKGDTLYLYTDGYADQFGGPKGKKFKYKPLNDLIVSNSNLALNKQKLALQSAFENWKGNLEQVDDVCVVGIKF